MRKLILAVLAIAVMAGSAFAGQIITIYGVVTSTNVYGNGQFPDGTGPADGDSNNNIVNFTNSDAAANGNIIYGGYVNRYIDDYNAIVAASNNKVYVNISSTNYVYGGYSYSNYYYADSYGGHYGNITEANNNTVNISNSIATDCSGGYAYSNSVSYDNDMANSNTVNIINSMITDSVYGGYAGNDANAGVIACNNTVTIASSSIANNIYGGYADESSADNPARASNNTVTITSSSTVNNVYGGYTYIGYPYVTNGYNGTANNNSVTIVSSTVTGNVYGGRVVDANVSRADTATGNRVTIGGTTVLSGSILYGGYIDGGSGDAWTGNTLNVKNSGMSVKGIYNFENLNFYLPTTMSVGQTMLTVTNAVDITNSKIGVIVTGGTALNIGDTVGLISTIGGLSANGINTAAFGADAGSIAKIYHFAIGYNSNILYATLIDEEAFNNPQTKALSEGQLGGLAFLNQGVDLIAGSGMNSAIKAGQDAENIAAFASVGVGSSKYETGSSVDVNGFSVMAGFAERIGEAFTAGVFFEGGNGNYNTKNSFNTAPSVDGSGDANYYGVGFLGCYDIGDSWYGEVSLRAGQTKTDFNSADFVGTSNAGYETSAIYYGAHIGAGRLNKLSEKIGLDLSAKLFYTHQGGDDVTVENDKVSFDDADSVRARIGGRLNYDASKNFMPYIGAFLDYELSGKAEATINGAAIGTPELTGATGIGELGVSLTPSGKLPLTIDLGLQGYAGKRQGGGGSLQAGYKF